MITITNVLLYIGFVIFGWFCIIRPTIMMWENVDNKSSSNPIKGNCHICGQPSENGAHYECFGPTLD